MDESEDGEDGLWRAKEFVYDGLILDLMLPKLDGLDVLAALRKQGNETPALLLSARNEVADRVAGLRLGADDYLGKPFALEELLARVDALCRRSFGKRSPTVRIGDLEVNLDAKTATKGRTNWSLPLENFASSESCPSKQEKCLAERNSKSVSTMIYHRLLATWSMLLSIN